MPTLNQHDTLASYLSRDSYYEPSYIAFVAISDYAHFTKAIENHICNAIRFVTRNPQYINSAGEDEITDKIICCLCSSGLDANHDAMSGGHADIVIKNMHFDWLGEAKIKKPENGYDYLWGGFLQLTERYSTNSNGCNKGGFFVYIKQENSSRVMERWQQHMAGHAEYDLSFEQGRGHQAFISKHAHTRFGDGCNITHFSISAFYDPKD